MATADTLVDVLKEKVDSVISESNGNINNISSHKARAASKLMELGFPKTKHEEYKYTPLTKTLERSWIPNVTESSNQPEAELNSLFKDRNDILLIEFRNGILETNLEELDVNPGAKITTISSAKEDSTEIIKEHFNKSGESTQDSFALLNTSLSNEGLFIHLERNVNLEKPVLIIHNNDGQLQDRFDLPRNLFVFEQNSGATIYESFQSSGDSVIFSNSLTEFIVNENSNVKYRRLGIDGENSIRVSTNQVYQEPNSHFSSTVIDFGGKMVRNNLNITSNGSGTTSDMYGLYLLDNDSHVDNHTMMDHRKPHSESNELYKGILGDSSRGVFNGKIFVRREAQKTNAFQQNANILLSPNANIDTKPQLEIWADDVKCSHGCTTGQIDEEQIFYLRSRGISENHARKMLVQAYVNEILDQLELDDLREFANNHLQRMLEKMN